MKMFAAALLLSAAATAQAGVLTFYTTFAPEAVGASGTGSATVTFDDVSHVLSYAGQFSGLLANSTAAHFHCCTAPFSGTAGVAVDTPSLLGFPLGVQAGSFSDSLDLDLASSFSPAFITASGGTTAGAITRFINGIYAGSVYLNIHSTLFPGGEIRGFLVPEPGSAALALTALLALGAAGAAKRRR